MIRALIRGALVLALPCLATAQIAGLQIKVLEGEAAVHPPGARVTHPLTVEVTDETGRPVSGAAVSFQLPPDGPSGVFSNGLRTDLIVTDASGRASLRSVQLNRTGGQLRVRITAVKEQARAGTVSVLYIGDGGKTAPVISVKAAPAAASGEITPTAPVKATVPGAPAHPAAKSGEITPTTVKMGSGHHKRWVVVAAAVGAGAGVALLGLNKAKPGSSSTVASSVVSIGTPTISIGHP